MTELQLQIAPVKFDIEQNEIVLNAKLNGTEFISHYRGCGNGIAYIERNGNDILLRAFNYGKKVMFTEFEYANVMMSGCSVCLEGQITPSLKKQFEQENEISNFIKTAEKVVYKGFNFLKSSEIPSFYSGGTDMQFYLACDTFHKTHKNDKPFCGLFIHNENRKQYLPTSGAYKGNMIDKSLIWSKWTKYSVVLDNVIRFYDGDNLHYCLINPDFSHFDNLIDDVFNAIAADSVSNNIKIEYEYCHE